MQLIATAIHRNVCLHPKFEILCLMQKQFFLVNYNVNMENGIWPKRCVDFFSVALSDFYSDIMGTMQNIANTKGKFN